MKGEKVERIMQSGQGKVSITGRVLEIQRMSTEDGPGIRTTVFFKGCPLRCGWCHNPESIPAGPQVQWLDVNCIGCGMCVAVCPQNALSMAEGSIVIDRSRCVGCGTCAGECPSRSMELLGTSWDSAALSRELVKDRAWFEQSDGGVTLSGGEATMQARFCRILLEDLQRQGIQTALDTCGYVSRRDFERLLPHVDVLLFDLKEIDSDKHRRFTGRGNERILENLDFAARYARDHSHIRRFWVRTPLIPGATARAANIRGIGAFIAGHLQGVVDRWELCAFNNLCWDKYRRLGLAWDYADTPLLSREEMESFAAVARSSGVNRDIVSWSGSTLAGVGGSTAKSTRDTARPGGKVLSMVAGRCSAGDETLL